MTRDLTCALAFAAVLAGGSIARALSPPDLRVRAQQRACRIWDVAPAP